MKLYRILRRRKTPSGYALDLVSLPGLGDSLQLWSPSPEKAIETARARGAVGVLVAVAVEERVSAMEVVA